MATAAKQPIPDNGEPHPHDLERMSNEGGPEPTVTDEEEDDDYRYLDPVNDRYNGFRV